MGHKEYGVTDILDILRRAKANDSIRRITRATGMDRNTIRSYLRIAATHGFNDIVPDDELAEIASAVIREVHGCDAKNSEPGACAPLLPHRELLSGWLETSKLTLKKVHIRLCRMGVAVTYSTLYRYAREELGFGGKKVTVRMAETEPGEVAQADFGRMGLVFDPESGRNRVLYALVVTLVMSRYQYVYLTHRQNFEALITGMEDAWAFFDGVARRLIIDNMKTAVVKADRYEPVFTRTFLDYSQHRGFIIDSAVVRHPEGKGTVENQVRYVRENFFKGEEFNNREHAQREAEKWCRTVAGLRIHGTTCKRPLLVFEQEEQKTLLALSSERFDIPAFATCIVHRDHHIMFKKGGYSLPTKYIGKEVDVRGDSVLVRIYYKNQLIRTHEKVAAGKRNTDYDDYGLGLRVGEISGLCRKDADFQRNLLVIRQTKFSKSRLVPFGPCMAESLRHYIECRERNFGEFQPDDSLFSFRGCPINRHTISQTLHSIIPLLGIVVPEGVAPPRPHSLRHSFAVGTLLRSYREKKDPAQYLLHLSTFLGHVNPESTAVYLTITEDLLTEAGERFARFSAPLIKGVRL